MHPLGKHTRAFREDPESQPDKGSAASTEDSSPLGAVTPHERRGRRTTATFTHVSPAVGVDVTTLRIPSPWTAPLLFDRPGRPFTPAESARRHRLAMIAETTSAVG